MLFRYLADRHRDDVNRGMLQSGLTEGLGLFGIFKSLAAKNWRPIVMKAFDGRTGGTCGYCTFPAMNADAGAEQ